MEGERPDTFSDNRSWTPMRKDNSKAVWWNFWTWPLPYQLSLVGAGASTVTFWALAVIMKVPAFAYMRNNAMWMGGMTGSMYLTGVYHDYHLRTRDAVVDHYRKLHPDDFAYLDPKKERKYSEIILPWEPIRVQEDLPRKPYKV